MSEQLGETPDWAALKADVCERIDYCAAAWEKLDAPPEWKDKIRRDLLLPALSLLAEFIACVEVADPDNLATCWKCSKDATHACSGCEESYCKACGCACEAEL